LRTAHDERRECKARDKELPATKHDS
jgi:hypothetical protein